MRFMIIDTRDWREINNQNKITRRSSVDKLGLM